MSIVDGYIQSLQTALGARHSVIAHSSDARISRDGAAATALEAPRHTIAVDDNDRATARQLAAALDRAIDLGEHELAERISIQSMRIAREHPMLAERIARLRAARGEFDSALALIESARNVPASMRLLRVVCLLHAGRRHEAHADLLHWARKASAPLPARTILAILEWEAGRIDDSAWALQRNLQQIEDPATLAALMLMAASQNRTHTADIWAERLRAACMTHPRSSLFETMLVAAGHGRPARRATITPEAVAALATELLAAEHLLPALAEAQRLRPDHEIARLVAAAIESALADFDDQTTALLTLADLHETLDERDAAAAWRSRADAVTAVVQAPPREDILASISGEGVVPASPASSSSPWLERAA